MGALETATELVAAKGLALAGACPERSRMGSADESTTGPANLILIGSGRKPGSYRSTRRQPAELEEQNSGKNVNAADVPRHRGSGSQMAGTQSHNGATLHM